MDKFFQILFLSDTHPFKIRAGADILHCLGSNFDGVKEKNYRRFKLNNYLEQKAVVDTVYRFNPVVIPYLKKIYRAFLFSDARNSTPFVLLAQAQKAKIIYDRTDNWSALGKPQAEEESALISCADLIFCSAHYLFDSLPQSAKKKAFFVPNGCDLKPYTSEQQYEDPTAAYIGRSTNKIDWNAINRIAETMKVNIYGVSQKDTAEYNSNISFKGFMGEWKLHYELEKCSCGIILFDKSDWTRGMLPLKLFHYANAHIPTFYANVPECAYYPYQTIAFDLEAHCIKDVLANPPQEESYCTVLSTADWKEKFDFMYGKIEEIL